MNDTLIEKPPFPGASTGQEIPQWELLRGIDTIAAESAARQHSALSRIASYRDKRVAVGQTPSAANGDDRLQKWAALRRRKVSKLARAVNELEQFADREDLAAHTFPVFHQLKTLLAELDQASEEGHTREILRQVRNTFLDQGWEQYRRPEVRRSVVAILDKVAEAEAVLVQHVREAFGQLTRSGMNAVGLLLPALDEEDEQQDVEEEEAVSR